MAERPKIGIEIHPAHSRLRRGLQRIRGPVKAWLSNRWNLRGRRRGRVQRERLQAMVSPIASMPGPIDTATRSAADLFDRLPFSVMLQFGYGMGESVVVAATLGA